jgi:hypothetical protein
VSDVVKIPLRVLDRAHIDDEADHAQLVETDAARVLASAAEKVSKGNVSGIVIAYVFDNGRVGWDISASGNIGAMAGAVSFAHADLTARALAAAEDS